MTLILRKLLASSSYAIYGTLNSLVTKLENLLSKHEVSDLLLELDEDFETADELEEEWQEEEILVEEVVLTEQDIENIKDELKDLQEYRLLAQQIVKNSKAEHLFTALGKGFTELERLGANNKALIFTESRRTQDFLYNILEARGYKDKVILFNGTNNDEKSKKIYKEWLVKHKGTDKVTGSPTADKRSALVEYFKTDATIMIATEAAAEGINLQFCSLIVNYDMPWNPQRIEQRIGRCHRYGQKHDVVVVNFLNVKNEADVRVYELLDQKFQLFDGVFGASDEVLGSIGTGVDFEKRIAQIYNNCRKPEEIQEAFDQLQNDLKPQISERLEEVKSTLMENFDEEVREKLRSSMHETKESLSKFEDKLWKTTQYFLAEKAHYQNDYSFKLLENPFPNENIHSGPYMILKANEHGRKSEIEIPDDTNIYRIGHKLAQRILQGCKELETPVKEVIFDYTNSNTKIVYLEQFIGKSGWMKVQLLQVNSFELEEYFLISCFTDEGEIIDDQMANRFFSLSANVGDNISTNQVIEQTFKESLFSLRQEILNENALRNHNFFDVEMDKLDQWADDMKISLEKEIKDIDAEIKLKKAEAKKTLNLELKVKAQREIKELENKRSEKRRRLFQAQDEIDARKEDLLTEIEQRLNQKIEQNELFTIKWKMI
jgi:superfamily II DNA/RNA helicase